MASDAFLVNLSKAQKAALLKRAALLTAQSGKRVTMSDLLRDALESILAAPMNDSATGLGQVKIIKFIPRPTVQKAIEQAHFNSGKPVGEILNEALAEAFQLEVVA